ncbi:VWA domain-containing protein [Saccharopolyspora sp. WRP15-2]|uniref:VWA domain-containing protein n=1 Tax=Saccharopolyspora oryzae TaxID=2997343 RepID=A0ABT4V0Q7_9PSEU|nr:VWA domain-containing protein [Saccharopolyspora oryzae]MDA3627550.1 VWA domain-containing protein [Saccharopolyspora oryzae]
MSLLDRHTDFLAALREHGIAVSTAEGIDAARALASVDLLDRETVRIAYAATLVKRHKDVAVFNALFDLWFPIAVGEGLTTSSEVEQEVEVTGAHGTSPELHAMRTELAQALYTGDNAALGQIARRALSQYGSFPGSGGNPGSWSPRAALEQLDPTTLLAGLMRTAEGKARPLGTTATATKSRFTSRIDRFKQLVTAEAYRRIAEQKGERYVADNLTDPALDQVSFLGASQADMAAMRRAVHPLAHQLATRIQRKRRHGTRSGTLDFRRTLRSALATGGVPIKPHFRPRRPHKPELVVLCDVSSSVANFAHFALLLVYTLHEVFSRTRVFAFVRDVHEVTDHLRRGRDAAEALAAVRRDTLQLPGTGTDHGRVFTDFADKHGDVLTPRTVLLILGDARNNNYDPELDALADLTDRCKRTLWLNPEPSTSWGTGDSVAPEYADLVEMAECRNLAQLTDLVQSLA